MSTCVVDASVVAAALFPEPCTETARALFISGEWLLAPGLVHAELANVIWKRVGRSEISADEARALLGDFLALPLVVTPTDALVETALELALRTERTVYDSLYVALALRAEAPLVTADRRLVNALRQHGLEDAVCWIGAMTEGP